MKLDSRSPRFPTSLTKEDKGEILFSTGQRFLDWAARQTSGLMPDRDPESNPIACGLGGPLAVRIDRLGEAGYSVLHYFCIPYD